MHLKIGDSVQLRNGGPCMIVTGVLHDGNMACCWFDGKELQEMTFPNESLTRCEAVSINDRTLHAILNLNQI
ncbi:DUF2158 domain-containing protein [Aeromonas veronii]|uniref:YodC family protein n=1 Tax=Aeromonas TaxID=642 RepID=UPI00111B5000|nr:DUF2158 domain-containing protein [Aeromonas veronii]TNI82854.1 DUF2158 domain-containing protein [Aeromonas veronii]TNJ13415.1 DUF2158 domain-containing protein [Aeromonas veronii]